MRKPIDASTHVAADYVYTAAILAAPTILGLKGPARAICYGMGTMFAITNALTDNRLAPKRGISLKTHGKLEAPMVPALLVLPAVTGALKQPAARWFFGSYFVAALANYFLTDYSAKEQDDDAVLVAGRRLRDVVATMAS